MRFPGMNRWRQPAIVIVLACIGMFVAWKFSWRGDPRFIGRWAIVDANGSRTPTEYVFDADGGGVLFGRNGPVTTFHWSMEEDHCVVKHRPSAQETADQLWRTLTGKPVLNRMQSFRVLHVSNERMRMLELDMEDKAIGDGFEIVRLKE